MRSNAQVFFSISTLWLLLEKAVYSSSHNHISASNPNISLQPPLSCPPNVSLPSLEQIVKIRVPTQKYVPKRIQSEWSRAWSKTIQDCIYINDLSSYTYLFLLTKVCLRIPPSNLRSRKAREDFTLNLIKRWRGTSLTNGNASQFFERTTLWNELLLFVESRPKTKFSQEEIHKKRVLQMVADERLSAACASPMMQNYWKNTRLKISQQMLRPQMVLSN